MADRRRLSQFDRAQEIDDLLERRQNSNLRPQQIWMTNNQVVTTGRFFATNGGLRPIGQEVSGNVFGTNPNDGELASGMIGLLAGSINASVLGRNLVAKLIDGYWVAQPAGRGSAVYSVTGVSGPLVGASVTLMMNGITWGPLTTNAIGQVTLRGLPKGTGTISASATGYISGTAPFTNTGNDTNGVAHLSSSTIGLAPTSTSNPIIVTVHAQSNNNSAVVDGISVTIKDPGGTTVFTGNTNASGQVSYTPVTTGTFTAIAATSGRWLAGTSGNIIVNGSGAGTLSYTVAAASGYAYPNAGSCDQPLKTSLTLTDPVTGTWTLTHGVDDWNGSGNYSWPGTSDGKCPAATLSMGYALSFIRGNPYLAISLGQANTVAQNGEGGGGTNGGCGCPTTGRSSSPPNVVTLRTRIYGPMNLTCPPSFAASFTLPVNWFKKCDKAFRYLYGDAGPTFSIIESP